MINPLVLFFLIGLAFSQNLIPKCGSIDKVKRGIQIHEIKTVCSERDIWIAEFYEGKRDGEEKIYTPSGKLIQVGYFKDGHKIDSTLVFDSTGYLAAKRYFNDSGHQVGDETLWFASGKVKRSRYFNSESKLDGRVASWYDDSTPEEESFYVADQCTSTVEYYRNGNKRFRLSIPLNSSPNLLTPRISSGESWSWSGRLLDKVVKGNGQIYSLPRNFNNLREGLAEYQTPHGYIETYKDSNFVKVKQLDSLEILKFR